jgi:hypothetical protein
MTSMTLHLAGDAPPAEKTRATIMTNQTMSEQSLAVVDAYYQAGLQGHLTDFAPYLHSDCSTTAPSYLPWGGLHAGAAFFRDEVLPNLPDVLDFGCFSYDVFHALPPRQCAGICRLQQSSYAGISLRSGGRHSGPRGRRVAQLQRRTAAASYITGTALLVDGGWTAIDGPPTGLTATYRG